MSLPKRRPDPKLPANQMTKMYTGVAEAATSPDVAKVSMDHTIYALTISLL